MTSLTAHKAYIKQGKEAPLLAGHPWIFSGAIERLEGEPADGDPVTVFAKSGRFVGHGFFNGMSQIRIRLYSWDEDRRPDEPFWEERLLSALRLRAGTLRLTGPCRLVFSEGDGLSGLTVDRYGDYLAVQFTSLAMARLQELWVRLLARHLNPRGIYLRTEKGIGEIEGIELEDRLIAGEAPEPSFTIEEEGLRFRVDLAAGQKTGFYLDQRENRLLVRSLAAGRKCLDACCYTGAFALNMARGGASSVTGVDVSENALALARENAALNGFTSVDFVRGDVFKDLQARADAGERYDLLVLDPPRFAQSSRGVGQALKGYLHLNDQAIRCLAPSGILVTCSCSGRVSREEFRSMITLAAAQSGRRMRILRQSGQAMDHPVAAGCPESEYLKCFFCAVD